MAEEKRLIGNDGSLATVTFGTTQVGNGVLTIPAKTWVKIINKSAAGSIFGGTATTGLLPGDFYYNPKNTASIAPTAGNDWQVATIVPMLDINGWTLKVAAGEIEVSTLADKFKKYRKGKLDADGTVSFVWIKGITDQVGGLVNQFFDIAEISAAGTVTLYPKSTAPLYLLGYLAEETTAGQVAEATLMQVELYDININVKDGEGSNQEPKFRLTGDSDPTIFRITVA